MHQPVMLDEVIEMMGINANGVYIDGTAGAGGHSQAICDRLNTEGTLLCIDRDESAIERVSNKFKECRSRCYVARGNFSEMKAIAEQYGVEHADGILLDLGMSSNQIEEAGRGFSFMQEGPLDMRMDQRSALTAEIIVNEFAQKDLAYLIRTYGEESAAGRISAALIRERKKAPVTTTTQLASIVEQAKGGRRGRIHPATQTFQALRIAVNAELESAETGIESAIDMLSVGGRLAVITFHSLEDRLVKQLFRAHEGREVSLQAGGVRWEGVEPKVRRINRKPICATEEEVAQNPRARSAKLRVVERLN